MILAAVAGAAAFYLALIVLGDTEDFLSASKQFNWLMLAPVIALVLLNYATRCERWHFLLSATGLGLPRVRSYWIFLSGLSMTVTPAKVGEALKAVLLKMEGGSPIERGLGLVIVERILDVVGVVVLIAVGAYAMPYGLISFGIIAAAIAALVILISSKTLTERVILYLKSKRRLKWLGDKAETPLKDSRTLLRGRNLAIGTAMSTVAWGFECVGFYLILIGLSADIGFLECVFVYAFSSVIGAISMLPGGMGTTEATMMALLIMAGLTAPDASFTVILTRICTLWLAVGIGVAFLGLYKGKGDAEEVASPT